MKTIAFISGTRADFGLMSPVLHAIEKSTTLKLRLYATGMHLMPEFGNTIKEIKKQFPRMISLPATFPSDDQQGTARFMADFFKKLVPVLSDNRPDILLLLGDRSEQLIAATVAHYLGIPTAHIHGGEKTTTVDDATRHAITQLASWHFAATKSSAKRIAAMGENKQSVYIVGAPALDVLRYTKLPGRTIQEDFMLLTLHPISEQHAQAGKQMTIVLKALKKFNMPIIAIYPNADAGGRAMIKVLTKEKTPLMKLIPSLPYLEFLALERDASVWVGNSSAMMIESPFFGTPVVNVGPRQQGRQRGNNVIDVEYNAKAIEQAIKLALKQGHKKTTNPWGDGNSAQRIVKILDRL